MVTWLPPLYANGQALSCAMRLITHCRSVAEKLVMNADGLAFFSLAAAAANSVQVVGGVMWYLASSLEL